MKYYEQKSPRDPFKNNENSVSSMMQLTIFTRRGSKFDYAYSPKAAGIKRKWVGPANCKVLVLNTIRI